MKENRLVSHWANDRSGIPDSRYGNKHARQARKEREVKPSSIRQLAMDPVKPLQGGRLRGVRQAVPSGSPGSRSKVYLPCSLSKIPSRRPKPS